MKVELRKVTRDNWEEAIGLKVAEDQKEFVPDVAVSLAKVYIKPDGDNVVYLPFAIYHQEQMVGFIMHAFVESTTNMYWINGFMIDEAVQKKGYGGAALKEMIRWIQNRFPQCEEIRLTVHKVNLHARKLYERQGFEPTGEVYDSEDVMRLLVQSRS